MSDTKETVEYLVPITLSMKRLWKVTQVGRSVVIRDRRTDITLRTFYPLEWGPNWGWNLNESGTGIVFKRW